uniref:Putative secreted protein n=1 Tax=Anopheles darlingi TaxID=43151 RepID=A0A2M4DG39_ANODA
MRSFVSYTSEFLLKFLLILSGVRSFASANQEIESPVTRSTVIQPAERWQHVRDVRRPFSAASRLLPTFPRMFDSLQNVRWHWRH